MHISSPRCSTHAPKVSTNKAYNKICTRISNYFKPFKLPLCGLVIFIGMNRYILTEWGNCKIYLKENYATALGICHLFTKTMLNMELNMILCLWSLHTLDIPELYHRFDEYLDQFGIPLACNIIRFFCLFRTDTI